MEEAEKECLGCKLDVINLLAGFGVPSPVLLLLLRSDQHQCC